MTKEFKNRMMFLLEMDFLNRQIEKLELQKKELIKQFSLQSVGESVLCLNVPETWGITNGKKYKVIKEEENHFTIINDYGKEDSYHKDWFKKI